MANRGHQKKEKDIYYAEIVGELFGEITECLDKIDEQLEDTKKNERYSFANIRLNMLSARDFLGEYYKPEFFEYQVQAKIECVRDELIHVIHLLEKGGWNGKATEWLNGAAKRTEKIRMLVSLFQTLPDERAEEMLETKEFTEFCVKESLLVSPMIASLKKSYDLLPSRLRLCLLCLAPFPENFIIKKRLLIYWWMAEGFVTKTVEKSAEEVGEENFIELIRMGFVQPWHEGGTDQPSVKGCKVHPWIRMMLVSIAMEARLFEFYARHADGDQIGWARVCLYADDDDLDAPWLQSAKPSDFCNRLKSLKAYLMSYEKQLADMPKDPLNDNRVLDRQKRLEVAFSYLVERCLPDLDTLLAEIRLSQMKPWTGDNYRTFSMRWERLETDHMTLHAANEKGVEQMDVDGLSRKQEKLLRDLEHLYRWIEQRVRDLEVLTEEKNGRELPFAEELFESYNLKVRFPSPMNEDTDYPNYQWEKLFAIINVNQTYLNTNEEWFKKLTKLRTLHLGRWRDSNPIPYIVVRDARFLNAFFRVACHLKYLSLRGISTITELPSTISKCLHLKILDLKACSDLQRLPSERGSLAKLTHLDVSACYYLQQSTIQGFVGRLKSLQTLKGLALKTDADDVSSSLSGMKDNLRKLSIILPVPPDMETLTISLKFLCKLRVLTITWRTKLKNGGPADIIELPPQLRKLHLRCYPGKTCPHWLDKHPGLETRYIKEGSIKCFFRVS